MRGKSPSIVTIACTSSTTTPERRSGRIARAYDESTKTWLLASDASGGADGDAPDARELTVDDAVASLLAKTATVVDVRDQFAFGMESVNGCVNVPLRRAEGSKLSPTYIALSRDAFAESLAAACPSPDVPLIFVGSDDVDERADVAAAHALSAGFRDVAVVPDTVSAWLKRFTASGRPKSARRRCVQDRSPHRRRL